MESIVQWLTNFSYYRKFLISSTAWSPLRWRYQIPLFYKFFTLHRLTRNAVSFFCVKVKKHISTVNNLKEFVLEVLQRIVLNTLETCISALAQTANIIYNSFCFYIKRNVEIHRKCAQAISSLVQNYEPTKHSSQLKLLTWN